MLKRLKNALLGLASASLLILPVAVPVTVFAQADIQSGLCAGTSLDPTQTTCQPADQAAANQKIKDIITVVINLFSLIVGVISVIMIIIGGLKYITSSGDSGNVTGAKNTILYAIIGLVVVALAQVIVRFVLAKATTPIGG